MTISRFGAHVAVYVLLKEKGTLLMLRRKNTSYYDGYLGLPSGHLEQGESIRQATIREAKEETGAIISMDDLEFLHVMTRPENADSNKTYICFFFVAKKWQGKIKNAEPHKCSELVWADPKKLPADTVPEVKNMMERVNSGAYESEFGW